LPAPDFDFVVMDALIIGLTVFLSLLLAEWLQLQRPYWVPVSCLAVLQGASLRAVWNRQFQRLLGTALGLLLTWGVFSLPLNAWSVSTGDAAQCGGGNAGGTPLRHGGGVHHTDGHFAGRSGAPGPGLGLP
jgi:hypothetical protein